MNGEWQGWHAERIYMPFSQAGLFLNFNFLGWKIGGLAYNEGRLRLYTSRNGNIIDHNKIFVVRSHIFTQARHNLY